MRHTTLAIAAAGAGLGACVLPQTHRGASVYAVVDRSEWVPAGYVRLDLATGRYELKPQAPRRDPRAEMSVRRGSLPTDQLRTFRAAYAAARAQGLRAPVCSIIISNAGPVSMELSGPGGRHTTPQELGCWSPAARRLYNMLEGLF